MTDFPRVMTRRLFRVVNGGTPRADDEFWDGDVAWATPVDLGAAHGEVLSKTERTLTRAGLETGSRAVPDGSLILSTRAPIGYVSEAGKRMAFNQGCRGLVPRQELDSRFYRYTFVALAGELTSLGQGSTFTELPSDSLADFRIPAPPLPEQRAIADYLDAETARIDALIEKKRQLLELLKEGREARDESLALGRRESGLPEQRDIEGPLRSIPKAWRFERNKTFLREVVDLSTDGSEELLSVSHLTGVTPRTEKNVTMFMAESLEGYKRVRAGDLVINTMWAWMGALGVSPIDGIVSPSYGVYRFDEQVAHPDYFDAVFRSSAYIAEMTRYSTGVWTSRLRLYPEVFLSLRAPVPELSEQHRIAQAVRRQSERTSALAERLYRVVDLLTERRQALITAAVRGQIHLQEAKV